MFSKAFDNISLLINKNPVKEDLKKKGGKFSLQFTGSLAWTREYRTMHRAGVGPWTLVQPSPRCTQPHRTRTAPPHRTARSNKTIQPCGPAQAPGLPKAQPSVTGKRRPPARARTGTTTWSLSLRLQLLTSLFWLQLQSPPPASWSAVGEDPLESNFAALPRLRVFGVACVGHGGLSSEYRAGHGWRSGSRQPPPPRWSGSSPSARPRCRLLSPEPSLLYIWFISDDSWFVLLGAPPGWCVDRLTMWFVRVVRDSGGGRFAELRGFGV